MILPVHRVLTRAILDAVARQYGLTDVPAFAIEVPPNRALGDLAVTIAFQLARALRKPPRVIAQEIAAAIGSLPEVSRIVAAPNGYLNVYLNRAGFLLARLQNQIPAAPPVVEKAIVEHTAINPNKAAHIGHLRNAALGDTLARVLRFLGAPVEVQNYIDDLGVQVADIVVGFREIEGRSIGMAVVELRAGRDRERRQEACTRSCGSWTSSGGELTPVSPDLVGAFTTTALPRGEREPFARAGTRRTP